MRIVIEVTKSDIKAKTSKYGKKVKDTSKSVVGLGWTKLRSLGELRIVNKSRVMEK